MKKQWKEGERVVNREGRKRSGKKGGGGNANRGLLRCPESSESRVGSAEQLVGVSLEGSRPDVSVERSAEKVVVVERSIGLR